MIAIEQLAQEPLPATWQRIPLEQLAPQAKVGNKKTVERLKSNDGTIPLIYSGDLNGTQSVRINKFVTEKTVQAQGKALEPFPMENGAVLMALAWDSAGTVGLFTGQAIFHNAVFAIPPDPNTLLPELLFYYFKNPRIKNIIKDNFAPGTKTYVNSSLVKQLKIPIPPRSQQEQLLTRIEALLPSVHKAQKLLAENQTRIHQLLASTLQEIFVPLRMTQWHHAQLRDLVTINHPLQPLDQSLNEYEQPSIEADTIHPAVARAIIDRTRTANTTSHTTFSPLSKNPDVIVYSNYYNKAHWQTRVAMPYADSDEFLLSNIIGFKYSSDLYQILVSDTAHLQPRFLFWSLLTPHFTQIMRGNSSPGKLTITSDKLFSYELFFPEDRNTQERISTYLDAVLEKVRQMDIKQAASLQAIERMEESILNQAFAGKL